VLSVTVSDRLEGVIYLEAFKEGHVREAIKGINGIFPRKVVQVPRNEMHQVYEMDKANKVQLKKKQWVRINNGLYAGDLAKVLEVTDTRNGAICKIIPRVLTEEEIERRKANPGLAMKPEKRLFNPSYVTSGDVRELIHDQINRRVYKWNKMCFRKGFLVKFFTQKNIEAQNPCPTYQEINSFRVPKKMQMEDSDDGSSSDSSTNAPENDSILLENNPSKIFSKGDVIKIIEGELKNLTGKVEQIDDNLIKFRPNIEEYESMLEIDFNSVIKYFKPGDSVRVIYGHFKGEKGLVTKLHKNKVYIFSSIMMKEFSVNANCLKLSSEISEAVDKAKASFSNRESEFRIFSICRGITGEGVY